MISNVSSGHEMPSTTLHNSKTTLSGTLDLSDQPGARSSPRNEASGNSSAISVTLVSSALLHPTLCQLTRSQSLCQYQVPSCLASPHSYPCSRCRPEERYNSSFLGRSSRPGAECRVELSPCHLPVRSCLPIRPYLREAVASAESLVQYEIDSPHIHRSQLGRSFHRPLFVSARGMTDSPR